MTILLQLACFSSTLQATDFYYACNKRATLSVMHQRTDKLQNGGKFLEIESNKMQHLNDQ